MKKLFRELLIISLLSSKIKEKDEIIEPRIGKFSEKCPYQFDECLEVYDPVTNKNLGYVRKLRK